MAASEDEVIAHVQSIRWSDPNEAVRNLEAFVSENESALRARLLLASLCANEYGEGVVGAERIYREVLDKDPTNLAGLCGLGLLHGHGTNVDGEESLRLLARAAELSDDPQMILNFANKAWDLSKFSEAEDAFKKLRSVAQRKGKEYLTKIAIEALRDVRKRRPPKSLAYSCPEL